MIDLCPGVLEHARRVISAIRALDVTNEAAEMACIVKRLQVIGLPPSLIQDFVKHKKGRESLGCLNDVNLSKLRS